MTEYASLITASMVEGSCLGLCQTEVEEEEVQVASFGV